MPSSLVGEFSKIVTFFNKSKFFFLSIILHMHACWGSHWVLNTCACRQMKTNSSCICHSYQPTSSATSAPSHCIRVTSVLRNCAKNRNWFPSLISRNNSIVHVKKTKNICELVFDNAGHDGTTHSDFEYLLMRLSFSPSTTNAIIFKATKRQRQH